jgi:hypothetical protein
MGFNSAFKGLWVEDGANRFLLKHQVPATRLRGITYMKNTILTFPFFVFQYNSDIQASNQKMS